MISSVVITAVFMIFQVFFLTRWMDSHQNKKDQLAWTPFRKLLLDSVVHCADSLIQVSGQYTTSMDTALNCIRDKGALNSETKSELRFLILSTSSELEKCHKDFLYIVQTVSPSMKPYAAQYCSELFWFHTGIKRALDDSLELLDSIPDEQIADNAITSHPLNGLWAKMTSINMFKDYRFKNYKTEFVRSVWKKEAMHFYEKDNEFLPPEDYARALDVEKSAMSLDNIPRTTPIKSFFEKE